MSHLIYLLFSVTFAMILLKGHILNIFWSVNKQPPKKGHFNPVKFDNLEELRRSLYFN